MCPHVPSGPAFHFENENVQFTVRKLRCYAANVGLRSWGSGLSLFLVTCLLEKIPTAHACHLILGLGGPGWEVLGPGFQEHTQ